MLIRGGGRERVVTYSYSNPFSPNSSICSLLALSLIFPFPDSSTPSTTTLPSPLLYDSLTPLPHPQSIQSFPRPFFSWYDNICWDIMSVVRWGGSIWRTLRRNQYVLCRGRGKVERKRRKGVFFFSVGTYSGTRQRVVCKRIDSFLDPNRTRTSWDQY